MSIKTPDSRCIDTDTRRGPIRARQRADTSAARKLWQTSPASSQRFADVLNKNVLHINWQTRKTSGSLGL